ncbi:hypothetical protein ABTX61_14455 [Amycolatopsis japonica]|uniref:hypothetical protein n=1 Tax=Amycolatopsis japonica TaxID=208439 RepID=UPI00332AA27A
MLWVSRSMSRASAALRASSRRGSRRRSPPAARRRRCHPSGRDQVAKGGTTELDDFKKNRNDQTQDLEESAKSFDGGVTWSGWIMVDAGHGTPSPNNPEATANAFDARVGPLRLRSSSL